MAEDGRARVRRAAANAQPLTVVAGTANDSRHGLPAGCPVTPLGLAGDVRYYLDEDKQMIALPAGDHTRTKLLGLFGAQPEFIYLQPRWQRRNAEGAVTGWRPELVAEDLMKACSLAGVWDPSNRERGRGAWRGEDGELILHVGDQIMIFSRHVQPWQNRQVLPPGLIGRYVYPRGERAGAPSELDPTDDRPADQLLELFDTWNWRRKYLDSVLLLGWVGAAMIGGALRWRPSAWLTGGAGTGKTFLQEVIKNVLAGALIHMADTSPAYIWQTLRNQTLPVDVDELEAEEDNRKQLAIVKLARLSASGGSLGRGSDKHVPLEFTLKSAFLFSSILIPPLTSADRTRLAVLDLDRLPIGAPLPDVAPARLRAIGAGMRRRLIDGWRRFDDTLEAYRDALAKAGHSARGADQFGTLLACADLLLLNGPDIQVVDDWVNSLRAAEMSETTDNTRDEDACLQHLMGCAVDPYRKGERVNIGEWINRAVDRIPNYADAGEARRVLATYGLRMERWNRDWYLAIANGHTGLAGLYDDTRWKTPRGTQGVWAQSLRRLDGAIRGEKVLYFGGVYSRATLVPLGLIPVPDDIVQRPLTV